ncbi:MAG: HAD family hydrolase [Desulfobulbaceae bacterium]|jgi:phosphoglycolate phosphatase|nr:HAD family hydrolase [Desulfobulbaceae bacterium]
MKTLCVFDLDGTLLNTLADLATACNLALRQLGLPEHHEDAYRFFIGKGKRALIETIVPPGSPLALVDDCTARFAEHYQKCWCEKTRPYPGVENLLRRLLKAGVDVAILSNKPHDFTLLCVRHFFPELNFLRVFGLRDGRPRKPDPASSLELMAIAGRKPEDCFFIGDSAIDMATGANAGMKTIGVTWGFRGVDGLKGSPADHLVTSADDIYRLVIEGTGCEQD